MVNWPSNGSAPDINTQVGLSSPGDTVSMPAGSFVWTIDVVINKNITLVGAGSASTFITTDAGQRLKITGGGGATDFSITGPASAGSGVIACTTVSGWRVGRIVLTTGNNAGQAFNADCPGVFFNSTMNSGNGNDEGVWTTALGGNGTGTYPTQNAVWTTDPDFGSANAIYVEGCTINGSGYISDFGYASRAVVRKCTITGKSKVDAHGCESNYRANRQLESYQNLWDCSVIGGDPFWTTHDVRGGAAMIFDETVTGSPSGTAPWLLIHHYGPETNGYGGADAPLLLNQFWTPADYPLPDQHAVGKNPGKVGGLNPLYVFGNTLNGSAHAPIWTFGFLQITGSTNAAGYAIGSTSITLTSLTGGNLYAGNIIKFAGDSHYYTVAVDRLGAGVLTIAAPGLQSTMAASATALVCDAETKYRSQTGNPAATFTMQDIIAPDRDVFLGTSSFNGTTGVGRGTKAQMLAITPVTTGVGFWVTDEGSWNTLLPANTSGQLYRWSGSAWVLAYVPYAYPHPLTLAPSGPGSPFADFGTFV